VLYIDLLQNRVVSRHGKLTLRGCRLTSKLGKEKKWWEKSKNRRFRPKIGISMFTSRQSKRDMPHMKHDMPHMKCDMPHMKCDMPHMKCDMPHMKRDMPYMKHDMPYMKRDI